MRGYFAVARPPSDLEGEQRDVVAQLAGPLHCKIDFDGRA
jgi:hypothetical protein